MEDGNLSSAEQLLPLVYEDLRRFAGLLEGTFGLSQDRLNPLFNLFGLKIKLSRQLANRDLAFEMSSNDFCILCRCEQSAGTGHGIFYRIGIDRLNSRNFISIRVKTSVESARPQRCDEYILDGDWKWGESVELNDTSWSDGNNEVGHFADSMLDFDFVAGARRPGMQCAG